MVKGSPGVESKPPFSPILDSTGGWVRQREETIDRIASGILV